MITSAPHVIITFMLHIYAGHPRIHHNRILQCVYIVAVQSTAQYNAAIDVFHQKSPETRNFTNVPNSKILGKRQAFQSQKLLGSTGSYQPNNHNSKFSRGNKKCSS